MPLALVQAMVGHMSPEMTMHYFRPDFAAARAAVSAAGKIGAEKSAAIRRAKAKAARTLRVWVDDIETARAIVGDIRPDAAMFRALVSKAGGRK